MESYKKIIVRYLKSFATALFKSVQVHRFKGLKNRHYILFGSKSALCLPHPIASPILEFL